MSEIEKLQAQARAISEKMGAIQNEETRKQNGPKVGKFFRTRNNYSCPEKPSDYWWLYAEVTRMDKYGWLYVNQFETDNRGLVSVRFNWCAMNMASSDWKQISEAQYNKACSNLRKKISSLR